MISAELRLGDIVTLTSPIEISASFPLSPKRGPTNTRAHRIDRLIRQWPSATVCTECNGTPIRGRENPYSITEPETLDGCHGLLGTSEFESTSILATPVP